MSKVLGYAICLGVGAMLLIHLVTQFNVSAANKAYAQGQAESMIIRAMSQSQTASAAAMFPYFTLTIIALGIIGFVTVIYLLGERKNEIIAQQVFRPADDHREDRPQSRPGSHPDQIRVGKRVAEQPLVGCPTPGEGGAG